MKRMGVVLAVGMLVATILSGCVVVPAGGWEVEGGYTWREGGGHHRYYPYHHYYHDR